MLARRPLPIELRTDPESGLPIAPTSGEWAALTPEQQADVTQALFDALDEYEQKMPPEGTPHSGAQLDTMNRAKRHFQRTRRPVFLATNFMVQYPGEPPFAPDLVAIVDRPFAHRNAWVVENEGRGPDFVLEVLFSGDRKKDLKDNVVRFARLGITEYFVFDGARSKLHGYRLAEPGDTRYTPIVPQYGHYPSEVLGLELAVIGDELRLFRDGAPVPDAAEEAEQLARIVREREAAFEAEAARAEAEAARAEAEAARAEAALAGMRTALRGLLAGRGLPPSAEDEALIDGCTDPARLATWLERATTAGAPEQVFRE